MPLGDEPSCVGARYDAAAVLVDEGFLASDGRIWAGDLHVGSFGRLPVTVELPSDFPHRMPVVRLVKTRSSSNLPRVIPHVESDGKLCLAPVTGVLLDATNPRGIVLESLNRARNLLAEGLSGENDRDFVTEFSAYWRSEAIGDAWFIADAAGAARALVAIRFQVPTSTSLLIADDRESGSAWLSRLGRRPLMYEEVFFVPLATAFMPPDLVDCTTAATFLDAIRWRAVTGAYATLLTWLARRRLPAMIVLSVPQPGLRGRSIAAARFEKPRPVLHRTAIRDVSASTPSPLWALSVAPDEPFTPVSVTRLDATYLLSRGGAMTELFSKKVAIIGCGAVGSRVTDQLASAGVGTLRLVDPEALTADNLHRHVLGVEHIGRAKAAGMRSMIGKRLPHVEVTCRSDRVEVVLEKEPDYVLSADLVVVSVGDETLELRLNELLGQKVRRVHTWLEPLGIGGHALATGVTGGPGCYGCLFEDDGQGLHNRAAFAEPGQMFQRSYAGCPGTFTPFGNLHADRTALEATSLVTRILIGREMSNVLISWLGDTEDFLGASFKLSPRANLFKPREVRTETGFAREGCPCAR